MEMIHLTNEGISVSKNGYHITPGNNDKDAISLFFSPIRNLSHVDNVPVFYGYRLEANDPSLERLKRKFLQDFKAGSPMILPQDYSSLLKKAVQLLNYNIKLSTLDLIVYPKSSSRVNQHLAQFIKDKSGATMIIPDTFVKNSLHDIEIDYNKIHAMKTSDEEKMKIVNELHKMMGRNEKSYGEEFKMKIYYPYQRKLFQNFIRFKDETSERFLKQLQSGTVLLLDDIFTSGTTLHEMIRILRGLGASRIVCFVLFKN